MSARRALGVRVAVDPAGVPELGIEVEQARVLLRPDVEGLAAARALDLDALSGRHRVDLPQSVRHGILALVTVDEHRRAFLDALLARDSASAREAVEAAVSGGVPIADVYLELLAPALREIGHRWAMGELNVAEEHYATAIAQGLLGALGARMPRAPKDGRLAVVSATPEELHALGTRMVADFLEADGWEVVLLGPGAPAADVAALVDHEQPDVVALSTSTAAVLDGVVELLERLRALPEPPLLVVGGRFWTAETRRSAAEFGADLVVGDPRERVSLLRERIPPP
jgi:MerR family transcriptional regulator, light-induced transcriptional regulator